MSSISDLPLTSNHWGTYRARVGNGRVQELIGFENDKDPSPIGKGIIDVQDGPMRIGAPMVRKSWLEGGPGKNNELRGSDPFIEISWEDAEKLVAAAATVPQLMLLPLPLLPPLLLNYYPYF